MSWPMRNKSKLSYALYLIAEGTWKCISPITQRLKLLTIVRHLELEEDIMESFIPEPEAYVANVGVQKNQDSKRKFKGERGKGKGNAPKKPRTNQQGKGNFSMMKDKSKLKWFKCGNKGHFANECSEPKKVNVWITHELCY